MSQYIHLISNTASVSPLDIWAPSDQFLKPEILDPQGKAVASALPRLGFSFATDVRQGKRFEITVEGEPTAAQLAEVEVAAEKLLSNPVIENFVVRVEK